MRKGIELPINTLVVVAIAVIIMLAMAGFFIGIFKPNSEMMKLEQDFRNACKPYVSTGCEGDPDSYILNAYTKWKTAGKYSDFNTWVLRETLDAHKKKIEVKRACGCQFV
ncbi:MAG: hypothetical protein GXO63_01515 [Candidatus Micrarchaeota archaeon]|nr:hypothetical protein [Candidatus Micrarchaeota archaeon]